ncbi:hypothetical protein Syun_018385 [Stephania yunnanensis]|uniref:Neprosin PEP catalytic domain-containing protein n=1 Tax=Stephania yunnanensis TaxID=152371 RepID=A0AAP0ITM9_9MAGN
MKAALCCHRCWLDKGTGNWWLQVEGEGIGYWPKWLIPALNDGASIVMWGGVTYVKTVDLAYNLVDAPKLQDFNIDCSAIHHVSHHRGVDKLGVAILYGGPGGPRQHQPHKSNSPICLRHSALASRLTSAADLPAPLRLSALRPAQLASTFLRRCYVLRSVPPSSFTLLRPRFLSTELPVPSLYSSKDHVWSRDY